MYSEYYGLTDKPFQLTPDPRFYFDSQTHRKAMAYLGYGLAQGEGFIVITGDIGAGKTTLVGHLMATIDKARLTAIQIASTQVGADDMLRLVAQGLGIATDRVEKAQLLNRIEKGLHDQGRAGKRTLLIVDEAQNLPVASLEELRMLSNFQSGGAALMQIVLLGQPEFRDKLQSSRGLEQLRQRIIASHHLEPMAANEIEPYVRHRLALAGGRDRPDFTADAFATLHRHTAGVPRRLNTLLGRVLLQGAVEQLETIDERVIDEAHGDMTADAPGRADAAMSPEPDAAPAERPVINLGERRPGAGSQPAFATDPALIRRVAMMEERIEAQDEALRRVLTLLVKWVEAEGARRPQRDARRNNAA